MWSKSWYLSATRSYKLKQYILWCFSEHCRILPHCCYIPKPFKIGSPLNMRKTFCSLKNYAICGLSQEYISSDQTIWRRAASCLNFKPGWYMIFSCLAWNIPPIQAQYFDFTGLRKDCLISLYPEWKAWSIYPWIHNSLSAVMQMLIGSWCNPVSQFRLGWDTYRFRFRPSKVYLSHYWRRLPFSTYPLILRYLGIWHVDFYYDMVLFWRINRKEIL